jgi:homoserine dehydrogenase
MRTVSLAVAGYGHVGRAFLTLVKDKAAEVSERYGLIFKTEIICKSDGCFVSAAGLLDPADLVRNGKPWTNGNPCWKPGLSLEDAMTGRKPGGCLVECTPSNYETGRPGLGYLLAAFRMGWNAVAASKGALVAGFRELRDAAAESRAAFGFSGATAAALPTLDIGLTALAGARIEAIQGILNGTTNYILTRMAEGLDYMESLKDAQTKGIAEPDPTYDVEGWDTAAKILIISNVCLNTSYSLRDVRVRGIAGLGAEEVLEARRRGRSLKLLATASRRRKGVGWDLEVRPSALEESHPLFHVNGTEKGITFLTDTMGSITVTGGRSNPRGTAAALLKDIINIYRSR